MPLVKLRLQPYADMKERTMEVPEDTTLEDLVERSRSSVYPGEMIIIVNGVFVPASNYTYRVRNGDVIEILPLLPGG